ncbi:hypothetical protein M8494_27895 [Serratia ureilytica]
MLRSQLTRWLVNPRRVRRADSGAVAHREKLALLEQRLAAGKQAERGTRQPSRKVNKFPQGAHLNARPCSSVAGVSRPSLLSL